MNVIESIGSFLIAITLLVFVHEWGHYYVARCFGIKILRFSIGFGPPLVRWTSGADKTEVVLSLLPLGGYIRMLGESSSDLENLSIKERSRSFACQPPFKRALVAFAGPAANFLFAILIYATVSWIGTHEPVPIIGTPKIGSAAEIAGFQAKDRIIQVENSTVHSWNEFRMELFKRILEKKTISFQVDRKGKSDWITMDPVAMSDTQLESNFVELIGFELAPNAVEVAGVEKGGAADKAGLETGDMILSLGGIPIAKSEEVAQYIQTHAQKPISVKISRKGADFELLLLVDSVKKLTRTIDNKLQASSPTKIGVMLLDRFDISLVQRGILDGLINGAHRSWELSVFSMNMIGKIFSGVLSSHHVSGPVAVANLAGKSARIGLVAYLDFIAFISISLAVFNILPIPVLDGGHILYCFLETAYRRPLPKIFILVTQKIGLAFVILVFFVALFNDFFKFL